jgi:magnesium transporter
LTRRLVAAEGAADASDAAIAARLEAGRTFWLDLHRPDDADLALMRDVLGIHPLAVADARALGQRPKVEEYGDMTYIVAFGAAPPPDRDRLVEVHIAFAERFLVSVRRDDSRVLDEIAGRALRPVGPMGEGPSLLYRLLDALADSFFPAMDEIDSEIDAIEAALARPPRDGVQDRIYACRRRLLAFRRVVLPQRDQLARIATGAVDLPGVGEDARRYFRDVEDHLIRTSEALDGYRELLEGANDVYLSAVSNRLNVVTKQLTVIAGIFLPLTFLTGFFGQNFPWMVDHIGGAAAFFALAIGLQVLAVLVLLLLFRRRGWL